MDRGARLRPTFTHPRAAQWRRPGGPWDRGPLDAAFAAGRGALVDRGSRLVGPQVDAAVAAVAGALRRRGVRRGTVVSWQLPNGVAGAVLYRAAWRLGALAAPLHHRLGPAEIEGALAQVDPVLVLADPTLPLAGRPGALELRAPGRVAELMELLGPAPPVDAGHGPARGSDLAVVLFTSGSTGTPKAVLHTHRALAYKATTMARVHGLGPGDAVLMPAPLAHVSGLLNGVLLPAVAGIGSVLVERWDPDEGLALIEAEQVTFMGAPPVFFSQMAASETFRPAAVSSLRLVSTGGASVSPAFVEATAEAFDCTVKRTYGSTEAPTVTTSAPGDPLDRARHCDGRPVGEVEVEIRDPVTGARQAPGEEGEIWLRGPELFVGYASADQSAAVRAPGGWYRSGDLGRRDQAGWLTVSGRLSDVIIRAGENISASEVEAALEAHPAVRHAVAVAVPDRQVGERVAAFVETSGPFDLSACREWFAERGVTRFKTPEFVVVVDALPVLAAGKPDRAVLRRRAAELGAAPT